MNIPVDIAKAIITADQMADQIIAEEPFLDNNYVNLSRAFLQTLTELYILKAALAYEIFQNREDGPHGPGKIVTERKK